MPRAKTPPQELAFDIAAVRPAPAVALADRCAVRENGHLVELAFWYSLDVEATLVRVLMPADALAFHFAESAREFHASLRETLAGLGISPAAAEEAPPSIGRSSPIYWANFMSMVRYGLQASVDCFYLSPRAIHEAAMAGRSPPASAVEALLTVRIMAPQLLGLLDRIGPKQP